MASRRGAQFSAVHVCLEALQHVCYHVPDFSHFKFQALHAGNIPVWEVTEHQASYNQKDVVKSMSFDTWVVVIYWNNNLSFFWFCPLAACAQWHYLRWNGLVGYSRPSYGETRVQLGVLYWEPQAANYWRTPVLHKIHWRGQWSFSRLHLWTTMSLVLGGTRECSRLWH
jgi:hypothetical protein